MGKASSNKKVARAAGIGGGRSHHRQTPWGYFGVIALIVILGVVGTVASRDRRESQINKAGDTAPTVGTVWQEGYAVYACGKFLPAISIKTPDPHGIDTRTAGIINIAPTVKSVAGKNAKLGKFASAVGMKLNAAELQVPGGHLYVDGASCEGKAGHVYIRQFSGTTDTVGELYDGKSLPKLNPVDVPFVNDDMLTIAFVPSDKAATIPAPPSYVVSALTALEAKASSTSTTTPAASTATTPATTAPATTTPKTTSTTAKG